jgi:magnesium transporter
LTFVTAAGTPLAVYLGEGRVATVHDRPVPEVEAVWTAYRRAGAEARGESADLTLYRVLERIVDGHERGVDALVARVEALNLDPRSLRDLDVLHRVIGMRREALALRQRIGPTVDLFGLLDGRDFPFVPARHRAYFEDLHERVRGMAGDIDQTRDLLAEDLEAFTSVQSQRVNLIMKVFTIVSVVFLPPTLIASVYGMNFRIPELRWPFGYAYSLALMAATVVAILLYVRRRGWLD